jgi:hypothetical protein
MVTAPVQWQGAPDCQIDGLIDRGLTLENFVSLDDKRVRAPSLTPVMQSTLIFQGDLNASC